MNIRSFILTLLVNLNLTVLSISDKASEYYEGDLIEDEIQPMFFSDIMDALSPKKLSGKSPTVEDISFLLFNPEKKFQKWNKLNTKNPTGLKSKKPFKIAIHGFISSCNATDFPQNIFEAYTEKNSEQNLICVDWGALANPELDMGLGALFHYPKAVNYTIFVGETLERFLENLLKTGDLKETSDVHLIGHSLGAHIAGVCGHEMHDRKKVKVDRITGLDPAGPFFYLKGSDSKYKLGKSDASLVDIIYSNVGQLGVGILDVNLGHVNFLPNGGMKQPFCKKDDLGENIAEQVIGGCSHNSAVGMFEKSIRQKIISCPCKSWKAFKAKKGKCKASSVALFGDKVSNKSKGKYCLNFKNLK